MNDEIDTQLMEDAARLSTEIAPARDLWPNIEATIAAPKHTRRMPYLAQAAAVFLLVGASSMVTYQITKTEPNVSPRPVTTELVFQQASFGDYQLSSGYKLARSRLQADLDVELSKLSPAARTNVEQNLQVIRDAIQEINDALSEEPDNVLLQELLVKTYREELTVMQKVGGLAQNVMLRNDI